VFRLGSVLYIATIVLFAFLAHYLRRIGWATVRDDARHPLRTVKLLLSEPYMNCGPDHTVRCEPRLP
jgi:hypothetical protein